MKKVLIVDDEPTILLTLSHFLKCKETGVSTAGSIEEAQNALASEKFDLVIADVRLGGMRSREGLDLLGHIKELSPETKVIIMTGYGSDEVRDEAYEKGAAFYYEKPVDLEDLMQRVRGLGIPLKDIIRGQ